MSRSFDINPAGGYLRELKARGVTRARSGGLPLKEVLQASGDEPLTLDQLHRRTSLEVDQLMATVDRLTQQGFLEAVALDVGRRGIRLTAEGEALRKGIPDA